VIDFMPVKRIGILFNPKLADAVTFSETLKSFLSSRGISTWVNSAWEEEPAKKQVAGSDLVFSIGGDGTILRAARIVIPHPVSILGVNFGRLGFMAELEANDTLEKIPALLDGEGWAEERNMLEAELVSSGITFHALNDVFVGRRNSARLVTIEATIDGDSLTRFRADGVLIATASGSTGYSLATSGPILHPEAKEIILKPISSHLTFDKTLVLSPETQVSLTTFTTHDAMVSIDGQVESGVKDGEEVRVKVSPYVTRLLRIQPKSYFYGSLEYKLKGKLT
jgi:NAD+ kinase